MQYPVGRDRIRQQGGIQSIRLSDCREIPQQNGGRKLFPGRRKPLIDDLKRRTSSAKVRTVNKTARNEFLMTSLEILKSTNQVEATAK
jgi:hypothetical protein